VDASRSANNKIHEFLFSAGQVVGRFVNDAYNGVNAWLTVTGGQAAGITSIATNSGSGAWAHTGTLTTTGVVTLSQGFTVAGLPAASAALKGARAFVTDSATPTYNSQVVGGGANVVPVFCNGNVWVWA
jgi:hypothetical protein